MIEFKVCYDDGNYSGVSKVYAVDTTRYRFLVCNESGRFRWVNTNDCILQPEERER